MEKLTNEEKTTLDELTVRAREEFGDDALFLYERDGKRFLVTLEESFILSGDHIASVPVDTMLSMLSGMYQQATQFGIIAETRSDIKELYQTSLTNTQESLARHALKESSHEA